MKKKFTAESEIFDHIRESLDQHEEAYIQGSWEIFLQKRKKNNRKNFLLIASGVAACLLIGFGGLNYLRFEKRDIQKTVVQKSVPVSADKPPIENKLPEKSFPLIASLRSGHSQNMLVGTSTKGNSGLQKKSMAEKVNKPSENQPILSFAADSANKTSAPASGMPSQQNKNKADTAKNSADSISRKSSGTILNIAPLQETQEIASVSGRKVRFGINFSPGVNSAQTSGSLDYTGGVSADITLSSRFLLSTGLQVQNQHVAQKIAGIVTSTTAPQDETKSTLINLDVPLNIIWKFFSVKSNSWYVSAGVSSLVYLNQQDVNTKYSNMLVPVSLKVGGSDVKTYDIVSQVSVTQNSVSPSQTFDLAGRINLMVGFETKLSDRMLMHFEPYARIPSPGQPSGSWNQTTTGINFKVSF